MRNVASNHPKALERKDSLCVGVDDADRVADAINQRSLSMIRRNSLYSLDAMMQRFGDRHVRSLADLLPDNASLLSISLSLNYITDAGAVALAEGLRKNRSIMHIDLNHNRIGAEGMKALAKGPMRLSSNVISWNVSENYTADGKVHSKDEQEAYLAVIDALSSNKNLLEYYGPGQECLQGTLATNRLRAEFLAEFILKDPGGMIKEHWYDVMLAQGAVIYMLIEFGMCRDEITKLFKPLKPLAANMGVDLYIPESYVYNIPSRYIESLEDA